MRMTIELCAATSTARRWIRCRYLKGGEQVRDWLKEKRVGKNLTQDQMAEQLGISLSYYNLIENGERQKKMDLSIANQLSVILGMTLKEIIELEGKE